MTISTSRAAYSDCFDIFDRALTSPIGIRVSAKTPGAAQNLVVRLHYARTLDRSESTSIYSPGDPAYGVSAYDTLIVRQPRKDAAGWWVYIEPRGIDGEVQELGAAE